MSTSVRDFEKAISMVSYGFDEIEDFYAKSSTRDMIGKVKIPLLFIQVFFCCSTVNASGYQSGCPILISDLSFFSS